MVSLGEITDVNWGNTSVTKESYNDTGYIAFSASGPDGFLSWYEHQGDGVVLSAIGANCGKCFLATGQWTAIKNTITIANDDEHEIDFRFIYYYLNREGVWVSHGGGQPFITLETARNLLVPMPPLPEQQRIAAQLDKADRLRRLRQYALDLGETYLQSVFLEMFGDPVRNPKKWDSCELQELIREGDTINYGVVQPGDDFPNGVPIVRVGDLEDLHFTTANLKRIDPQIEASYKRSRLVGDEVLIACVGSIGKIALAHEGMKGFNIVRAVARVPFSDSVNRLYLATYLSTKHIQDYFKQETRTVSQPTLNILQIQETPVVLPPLTQQEKFAGMVRQYDRLRAQQRESMRQAEMLFGALLEGSFGPHP